MGGLRKTIFIGSIALCCAVGCQQIPAAPGFTPPAGAAAAPVGSLPGGQLTALQAASVQSASAHPDLLQLSGVSHVTKATCTIVTSVCEHIKNKLGMKYPGLETKAPLKAITDPANLGPEASPAVQAAAKVKAEEEQAPQKIKGLRYLGSIGCGGCYPDVEEALLAGLDDCTEAVRWEAVNAIRSTVGNPCTFCKASACCSPAVREKLKKVAYDIDEYGCFKEPSGRVRRVARLALCGCGSGDVFDDLVPEEGPEELPDVPPAGGPEDPEGELAPPDDLPEDPEVTAENKTVSQDKIQLASATIESKESKPKPEMTPVRKIRSSPQLTEVTWEQIMIDPVRFDSVDRARNLIIYLRARARGKDATRPDFSREEVSITRKPWTNLNDIEWQAAQQQLEKMEIGGISPILTHQNCWYLVRLLGRRLAVKPKE